MALPGNLKLAPATLPVAGAASCGLVGLEQHLATVAITFRKSLGASIARLFVIPVPNDFELCT